MLKKLFLVFFLVPMAANAVISAAVPTGRPSAMGRAPTMPGIGISAGIMSGGSLGSSIAGAGDSRCAKPLPDEITTSRCIQKYMACLRQDIVCGEHFESCDNKKKFTQKRIFCDERLLECPDEGITGIYGVTVKSTKAYATCEDERKLVQRTFSPALNTLEFTSNSMLDAEIKAGSDWVASNAVTACNNVVDGCIKRACQNSAFKCTSIEKLEMTVDSDGDGLPDAYNDVASMVTSTGGSTNVAAGSFRVSPVMVKQYVDNMIYSPEQAKAYLKNSCETEVGSNKSCFIFVNNGMPPNDSWMTDNFEVELIYSQMVQARMASNQNKILEWLAQGVGKSVDTCKTAARNCVTSACGSGSIAACYGAALDNGTVTAAKLTQNIGNKCESVVNAEQSCRDVFVLKDDATSPIWDRLWGTQANNFNDAGSLGLAQQLASELAQMFSDTTVRNLFTQCRNEAESCVRRECGTGFKSCYINDIWLQAETQNNNYGVVGVDGYGSATATDNAAGGFDATMAKSLCILPIKRSETCQKYFDIEYAKNPPAGGSYSFGGAWGSMNQAWNFAGTESWTSSSTTSGGTTTGSMQMCSALKNYFQDTSFTTCARGPDGVQIDPACVESSTITATGGSGAAANAQCAAQEDSIFSELIADVAQTARATLTREQNLMKTACETHRGASSLNDTYMWAAKPQGGAPENYSTMGLGELARKSGTPNLWGGFCQVKVMMKSDDATLGGLLNDGTIKSSAFFALGDAVKCGSWLTADNMTKIEEKLKGTATAELNWAQRNKGLVTLISTIGGAGLGGAGGYFGGKALGGKIGEMQGDTEDETKLKTAKETIYAFESSVKAERQKVEGQNSGATSGLVSQKSDLERYKTLMDKAMQIEVDKPDNQECSVIKDAGLAVVTNGTTKSGIVNKISGVSDVSDENEVACKSNVLMALDMMIGDIETQISSLQTNVKFTENCVKDNLPSHNGLSGVTSSLLLCEYTKLGDGGNSPGEVVVEFSQVMSKLDGLQTEIDKIKKAKTTKTAKSKGQSLGSMIGMGVGAVGGGILGGVISNNLIQNSIDAAESEVDKKAIAEWYANVGSKIQCTIGGKVVGTYGEVIELK